MKFIMLIKFWILFSYNAYGGYPGYITEKHISDENVAFTLPILDVNCTLGWRGGYGGQYVLRLDDKKFIELPEFGEESIIPDVAHSVTQEHYGENTQRFDWLVFLKGQHTPVSIEHNMRSGHVVLDVCGKPEKSWIVKSFTDAVEHPYNF